MTTLPREGAIPRSKSIEHEPGIAIWELIKVALQALASNKLRLKVEGRRFIHRAHERLPHAAIGPDGPQTPIALVADARAIRESREESMASML